MSLAATFFYLLAAALLGCALAAAFFVKLRRAVAAWLAALGALAGLFALAGCWIVAALQVVIAASGGLLLRRLAAVVADDAERREAEDAPSGRIVAAIAVTGFLLLAARVLMIARWPLSAQARAVSGPVLTTIGLTHYLLLGLVLFGVAAFIVSTRRTITGVLMGAVLLGAAAVLELVAVASFVGDDGSAHFLAGCALVAFQAPSLALHYAAASRPLELESMARPSAAGARAAAAMLTAVSALTLALLSGVW